MRVIAILLLSVSSLIAQTPRFFQSPYTLDQMKGKQAVVETSMGTIVFQLLPEVAPNHVGHFMKLAADGSYAGTTIHRVIKYGIIQGGDPLSKDPAKSALYGTGGLGELKAAISSEKHTAGAHCRPALDAIRHSLRMLDHDVGVGHHPGDKNLALG